MKLQTKLSIALLGSLLAVYGAALLFQQHRTSRAIEGFAANSRSQEQARQWDWVDRLRLAASAPLMDAMADGEMEKFSKLLAALRSLPELQEVTLFNDLGRAVRSTDSSRLGSDLPASVKARLYASPELVRQRTSESFEIYQPLVIQAACRECHVNKPVGQIHGVMSLRFSTSTQIAAEKSWLTFAEEVKRSSLLIAVVTSLLLIVVAGLLVVAAVRWLVSAPLKRLAGTFAREGTQLAETADAVASASQSLAAGANEQASSLEESSASLEEMASMTQRNAENAMQAKTYVAETRTAAEEGAGGMRAMTAAMAEIKASSDDIGKIIKTIDEIAFQTNILALNAAIEAAQAGEAGAGFAVVANEVRRLAQRSAEAARETTAKIEAAIDKTAQGVSISATVEQSLVQIVEKIRRVDELVAEVSRASREQSDGVNQITMAVSQMDKVVQSNAASAEESAGAAEQLNAQAAGLKDAVGRMMKLVGTQSSASVAVTADPAPRGTKDLIQWDEAKMSTGVATVDGQHQELIGMINRLHHACVERRGKDELREMLRFLSDYVQKHFRHEEELMERHRCPAHAQNRQAHQNFLRDFTALATAFEESGANTSLLLDLQRLVSSWLTTHICRVDTKLRSCRSAVSTAQSHRHENVAPPELAPIMSVTSSGASGS